MNSFNSMKRYTAVFLAGALVLPALLLSCASTEPRRQDAQIYADLGKPDDPVPFMEKVRAGVLPGGLRYFILENSRPENRAYLTLAVNAGSVLEREDERGLAHFVEHMAFNGTTRFPESELINYLRSLGMRFGPEVNAYTTFDHTVYGIEVPVEGAAGAGGSPVKRVPSKALEVLADWTGAITFDPKDVDEERAVIMEEYRNRLGAINRLQQKMLPILFSGSPYAERLPIGLPAIIEQAPAKQLEEFYRRWYRPDNMALIVVGDFDGAALEAELPAYFPAPPGAKATERPRYDLPAPKKGNFEAAVLTDPELTFTYISLHYKRAPQPVRGDLAAYREGLTDLIIDRILSLRFDEAAQKPDAPYITAGAGGSRYGASSRYYTLAAEPKSGEAEASLQKLLEAKESLRRFGCTGAEIELAKASVLSDLGRQLSEQDRQESQYYVSSLGDYFLEGEPLPDLAWEYRAVEKLLPGITAADITRQIRDYFEPGDLRVLIMAPESEKERLPNAARIRRLIRESSRLKLRRPQDLISTGDLVPEKPRAGSVRSESRDGETGALVWELENGARLILKETANRNNEVSLYAMARGGTVSAEPEEYISASLAAEIASASGLGPWPRPQLVKLLADKQVNLSFWTGNYYRGFQGSATTGDLKTLFEMLYLSFTRPRLDEEALRVLLDGYRTILAKRGENPDTVFSDTVARVTSGGHPYFKPLEAEDLSRVDQAQAQAFLARCLNPADYTFIFTGNLDPAEMRNLAETWLASIPPADSWNAWTDPGIRRPGKSTQKVYKGKEEQSMVFMGWYAPLPFTEEQSVTASVLSEYLDILFTEDIREKMGGVYSIAVEASVSPVPAGELAMQVYFTCDPKRAEELSGAVEALLGQTAGAPVNGDIFTKAVEALKKNWETSIQSNFYIAQSYANSAVLLEAPLSRLNKRPALYEKVQPGDIQALCRRLLPQGPVKVLLYPEAWTPPGE
jgi:zinc protease